MRQLRQVRPGKIDSIHQKLAALGRKFNILSPISNIRLPQLPSTGGFSQHACRGTESGKTH
jgi:hypothetical protein